MKNQSLKFALICTLVFAASFNANAQGFSTTTNANGTSNVMIFQGGIILTIDGESAKLIFKSLAIREEIPPYSPSVIKSTGQIRCVKNPENSFCNMGLNLKASSRQDIQSGEGGVVSGGGGSTVTEANGESQIMVMRDGMILSISGDSAKLLFKALPVQAKKPPYSSSVIKETSEVSCTKNGNRYFCNLAVNFK